jgi:hypothetical protein
LYLNSLFDGLSHSSTYQPPANVGITRASGIKYKYKYKKIDVCYSVTGWLKRHLEYATTALDGGNYEQYISLIDFSYNIKSFFHFTLKFY